MSEIRFRPGGVEKKLIPPVEPVAKGQGGKGFTEGEERTPPETLKVRGGEKKRCWVPSADGTYGRDGKPKGTWELLTRAEADKKGVKWGE